MTINNPTTGATIVQTMEYTKNGDSRTVIIKSPQEGELGETNVAMTTKETV